MKIHHLVHWGWGQLKLWFSMENVANPNEFYESKIDIPTQYYGVLNYVLNF